MKIVYDQEANITTIKEKKIAIIGYGSQGHAHAQNLRDSGLEVVVGLRPDSKSAKKAIEAGFEVQSVSEASKWTDIIMILVPDENQAAIYKEQIEPNLKENDYLAFAHGFNIIYNQIAPPSNVNVMLIAPKAPGHLLRNQFVKGNGVPCLLAIDQDYSQKTEEIAVAYSYALGCTRAGALWTTFREETESDLFGEQCVLCGGITQLVKTGFEVLTEAGYAPEVAYFECLHEMKLIVDLIYEGGLSNMRYSVSDTAEYGDMAKGPLVIDDRVKENMRGILEDIKSGNFAKEWILENKAGRPTFNSLKRLNEKHQIEKTGKELRRAVNWLDDNRIVDKSKN